MILTRKKSYFSTKKNRARKGKYIIKAPISSTLDALDLKVEKHLDSTYKKAIAE